MGIDMTPDPRNPNINGGATCLTTGGRKKGWEVHKMVGNFSTMVFFSTIWYEVQNYLMEQWEAYCRREHIDPDDEVEHQLFASYYTIKEV